MTPAARVQAAIDVLTAHLDGVPTEKALIQWARGSRFAGSKDRAAVRDHVFGAIRKRRSLGAWPNANPRLWMAAKLVDETVPLADIFNGQGYGPIPLNEAELSQIDSLPNIEPDVQDWVFKTLQAQYGDNADDICQTQTQRAPITVRVNTAHSSVKNAKSVLADQGIETRPNPVCDTALTVVAGDRKIKTSQAYLNGLIELQDAASQAICQMFPEGGSILDYCAGGGGKSLALAMNGATVTAHDAFEKRMQDIPERARRAGVNITIMPPKALNNDAHFDGVFCDVPCSGSGAWRRSPDHKWNLSHDDLKELCTLQREIIAKALKHVKLGGHFAYATCSIFEQENQKQTEWISKFYPNLSLVTERQFIPTRDCDGLYVAVFC